jgi:hypothetical protein
VSYSTEICGIGLPVAMERNPELGITFHCYWQTRISTTYSAVGTQISGHNHKQLEDVLQQVKGQILAASQSIELAPAI